ncbi:uncharacterized protein LOC133357635 isoform X6 [Lethenteron reissneri]|uniref:uncharacterized protein LOC133357635 isoform X6 n=1 Tax=Lethenteron reissneri TaxID=7753 RepID=UPI002AB7D1FB|nr:uncharacterized protein LOC133357635 isoform X6 [Lethenteron reissneri]
MRKGLHYWSEIQRAFGLLFHAVQTWWKRVAPGGASWRTFWTSESRRSRRRRRSRRLKQPGPRWPSRARTCRARPLPATATSVTGPGGGRENFAHRRTWRLRAAPAAAPASGCFTWPPAALLIARGSAARRFGRRRERRGVTRCGLHGTTRMRKVPIAQSSSRSKRRHAPFLSLHSRRDRIVARILERQDELHRTLSFALPAHPAEPHAAAARQPGARPHARGPLIPGDVCAQRGDVVERFYEGGRKFSTFFADGTGQVLDPAGRVVLQAVRGPGGPLVWVAWAQGGRVLAVLGAAGGGAVCVSASGGVRLVVTPSGGRCYGARGWETRRWLWEDAAGHHAHHGHHAHAPPLQPVDVPLGARAPRVRLLTREDAVLTYVARNRSVRLRVAYQPPGGGEATERGPDSAASAVTEASDERALGALVARIRAALGGLRRAGRASDTNAERPSRVA